MAVCLLVALPLPVLIPLVPVLTPISALSSSLLSGFCLFVFEEGILEDFPYLF